MWGCERLAQGTSYKIFDPSWNLVGYPAPYVSLSPLGSLAYKKVWSQLGLY